MNGMRATNAGVKPPINADQMQEGKLYLLTLTKEGITNNVSDYTGVLAYRDEHRVWDMTHGRHANSIFSIGSLCAECHNIQEVTSIAVEVAA